MNCFCSFIFLFLVFGLFFGYYNNLLPNLFDYFFKEKTKEIFTEITFINKTLSERITIVEQDISRLTNFLKKKFPIENFL